MSEPSQDSRTTGTMSLADHLGELRERLLRALFGIAIINAFTLWYGREILAWLCQPLFESQRQLGLPQQTVNFSVAGGFMVYLKVALISSVTLGAPWIFYQLWKFIAPGLRAAERRVVLIIVPLSGVMVVLGAAVLYFFFLPAAISFLLMFSANYPPPNPSPESPTSLKIVTNFFNHLNGLYLTHAESNMPHAGSGRQATQPATRPAEDVQVPVLDRDPRNPANGTIWFDRNLGQLRVAVDGQVRALSANPASFMVPQIEINNYINFVLLMALVTLLAFQLPVLMTTLAAVGLLQAQTLAKKRKWVFIGLFVVGVFITPSQDLFSNIIFPLMLYGLFEVGLVTMRLVRKPVAEAEEG